MKQADLVNDIQNAVTSTLALIEQAQARAATIVQEYNKLGGATFLAKFNWAETDVNEVQIASALYSLQQMADILGGNGVNLYAVKQRRR